MIESILDTDLYKLTMQQAVLEKYPQAQVAYRFFNRRPGDTFDVQFLQALQQRIGQMAGVSLARDERDFLASQCPYLKPQYLDYLANYRFNPSEVRAALTPDQQLELEIAGPWHRTILWEVPLLAIISQTYFELVRPQWSIEGQAEQIVEKGQRLCSSDCTFADFGTRRRRHYDAQDIVVRELTRSCDHHFVGTSNVHLAHKHGTRPLGTMAHEWMMGVSVLESLRHANRFGMQRWAEVYGGDLGTVLPDTFGTDAFIGDFHGEYLHHFDSIRHDSGDPFEFADKVIRHYQQLGIDPRTKAIIFSDSLTVDRAIALAQHCTGRIRYSFGIGTHLTNDFPAHGPYEAIPALNIVIKLHSVDGVPVVKLSDEPGKAIGQRDAQRVVRWTFFGTPLDA